MNDDRSFLGGVKYSYTDGNPDPANKHVDSEMFDREDNGIIETERAIDKLSRHHIRHPRSQNQPTTRAFSTKVLQIFLRIETILKLN